MVELLFLLLPLAFYSGWKVARNKYKDKKSTKHQLSKNFVKGVNFLLNEEPDKALEVFLNYPDIDQYTAETYQLLGNLFRNRGEVDRALRVHQNLIARANLNIQQKQKAMYSLGLDFFAAGMLDRAESVFFELLNTTQSIDQVSKYAVCTSLRTIYEQTQEWEKAIEATNCYRKYKKNKNDDPSIDVEALVTHYYCELADDALLKGNIHEVETLIKKGKTANKRSTRLMTLEADVFFHQKNYVKSLKKYLNAINNDSRLLSMFFDKLEVAAIEADQIKNLQKQLLKLYTNGKDKSVFEKVLFLAQKYGVAPNSLDSLIISVLSSEKLNIESISKASEYINTKKGSIDPETGLVILSKSLEKYLEGVPSFRCIHCGYKMHDFLWRCPACNHWDTIKHA